MSKDEERYQGYVEAKETGKEEAWRAGRKKKRRE
jgi:hypothetical protein